MTRENDEKRDADEPYETGNHRSLDDAFFEYVLSRDKSLVVEPKNADLDRGDDHPHEKLGNECHLIARKSQS